MSAGDDLLRVLEAVPRHEAPAIAVEGLVRRLAWRRLRVLGICLAAVGGGLLALLLLRDEPTSATRAPHMSVGQPLDGGARAGNLP